MANSTKIRLSNYAILEYIYGTDSHLISEYNFNKLTNTERKISVFHNEDKASSFSKNSLDFTFIELEGDLIGHADIDRPFSLHEIDDNIDLNNSLGITTSLNVEYDTVKIHLLAGFNLNGLNGIGLRISGEETTGDVSYLLSHLYSITEGTLTYNSEPFSMGDQIYDRFVEIKVPSLSYLNSQYYNLQSLSSQQLASYLTVGGKGFKKESPIKIEFFQFYGFAEIDDRATYKYTKLIETSLPQVDENSLITATIQESSNGDYFEFFAQYDGNFIADRIAELNSLGELYVIVNEIRVYENYADLSRVKVQEFPYIQTGDFDKVNIFRPVISDTAYSFIIEYTMKLINQIENTQIIRTATLTGTPTLAKKYGIKLGQINVQESSFPIKIYNRLTNSPYELTFNQDPPTNIQRITSEVVRYTDSYNISIYAENSIESLDKAILTKDLNDENFIYGNGLGFIYISNFDNFLKFKFFNISEKDSLEPLNLVNLVRNDFDKNEKLSLVFFGPNNSKKYIYGDLNTMVENRITFKIPSRDATKISGYSNKTFNIVYENAAGEEVNLYEGKFTNSIEVLNEMKNSIKSSTLDNKIEKINSIYTDTNKKLDQILKQVQTPTTIINNITPSVTNETSKEQVKVEQDLKRVEQRNFDYVVNYEKESVEKNKKIFEDIIAISKIEANKKSMEVINNAHDLIASVGTSIKSNDSISEIINLKNLNLTEVPGKETNFKLDSSIKKIVPSFLKTD